MPLTIGLSGYSWPRYLLLDAIGAGVWAGGISLLAYSLGNAMGGLLDELRHYQILLLAGVVLLLAFAWLYRWSQRRRG